MRRAHPHRFGCGSCSRLVFYHFITGLREKERVKQKQPASYASPPAPFPLRLFKYRFHATHSRHHGPSDLKGTQLISKKDLRPLSVPRPVRLARFVNIRPVPFTSSSASIVPRSRPCLWRTAASGPASASLSQRRSGHSSSWWIYRGFRRITCGGSST